MGQASHFWKVNQYFLNKNKNRSQSSTLSPLASESIQNLIDFPSTLGRKRGERKTDKLSSLKNEIWQKCQKSSYFFFSWQILLVKIHMEDLLCIAFFMLWRKNESIHHEEREEALLGKYAFDPSFEKSMKKGFHSRKMTGQ